MAEPAPFHDRDALSLAAAELARILPCLRADAECFQNVVNSRVVDWPSRAARRRALQVKKDAPLAAILPVQRRSTACAKMTCHE